MQAILDQHYRRHPWENPSQIPNIPPPDTGSPNTKVTQPHCSRRSIISVCSGLSPHYSIAYSQGFLLPGEVVQSYMEAHLGCI